MFVIEVFGFVITNYNVLNVHVQYNQNLAKIL